jgi:hypothetical protein
MTGARSFVRLAFAGFFVSSLIVACTVKNETSDSTVSCHPGDYKDCSCSGSTKPGQKECNGEGNGYEACHCDGSVDAGGNGNGDSGAGPVSTGGTTSYAGTTNGGSISYAGEPAGGAPIDAASGGAAGAGGQPGVDLCGADPTDDCASCYQQGCCDEWTACLADDGDDGAGDCTTQFLDIVACAQIPTDTRDATPDDLRTCGEDEVAGGNVWSAGLRPTVKPLVDCVAGGMGWSANPEFSSDACKIACFDKR